MERFLQRDDNVLIRYSSQKSAMDPSSSTSSSVRNSDDIDFRDVFGGPPRRYSSHDKRNSSGEAIESRRFRGEDESISSSGRWSGLGEKPVFGEEGGNRRRYTSDDFFDDIFKGGEDKDPYSSTPGSRIMSPARPLPAKSELFASSLTDQFSLPAKSNKGMDVPSFTSPKHSLHINKDNSPKGLNHPYSPSGSLSRLSSQSSEGQNESRNDTRSSYRQSPLSIEFSLSADGTVKVTDSEGTVKKESKCCDVPLNSSQFHFSIYKWASKGVPTMTSLRNNANSSRLKENSISRCLSSNGRIERDNMVCESPLETLSGLDFLSSNGSVTENSESNQIKIEDNEIVKDSVLDVPKQNPLQSNTILSNTREERKLNSVPEKVLDKKEKVKTKFEEKETRNPELKPLRSVLLENEDGQGKDGTSRVANVKGNIEKTAKKSLKNIIVGRNIKKRDEKKTFFTDLKVDKTSLSNLPTHIGENLERNKVKEFVKIFNQEAPSERMTNVDTQSQSWRWKAASVNKAEKLVYDSTATVDKILQIPNIEKKETFDNTSVKVEEHSNSPKEQDHGIDTTIPIISDAYEQKDCSSSTDGYKASLASMDDFFDDDFSVKELSQDHNVPQSGKDEEDFKAWDAKIRGWYTGKETNIRSLLSTLQYVLWPESGWKPVPLVDIIEGNSVKRSYQKALLCLHPDKLQQKGAAAHQKYIAEKVFDILQDAWIHFNSLGSLDWANFTQ